MHRSAATWQSLGTERLWTVRPQSDVRAVLQDCYNQILPLCVTDIPYIVIQLMFSLI
jgi:hypothetical protein